MNLAASSIDTLLDEALLLGALGETRPPRWTAEEDAFLRLHLGYLSDEEIGQALGRSANAVHLRRERNLALPAPSKTPGWHTQQGVARLLGVDIHAVARWVQEGWLPARLLPGERNIRVVSERHLVRFAANPMNWIYFKPERVTEPRLRRLLDRQRTRWNDEWWTSGQAAAYHDVTSKDINRYLHMGKLRGAQWGNWYVLRSEATRPDLVFYKGKGAASVAASLRRGRVDEFAVLAVAVGLSLKTIEHLVQGDVRHRLSALRERGELGQVARSVGASYDEETGCLWADWRRHRQRFPGLVRRLERWAADDDLDMASRHAVRGVLRCWARWFAETDEDMALARKLGQGTMSHAGALARAYEQMKAQMGIDPLAEVGQ